MANVKIYAIKDCYLKLKDETFPVSQFSLDFSENGIPTLSVGIDMHTTTDGKDISINPFEIGSYFSWYKRAQALCDERLSDTSFYFKSIEKESGEEQVLSIDGWVCVQPGFNRATASVSALSAGITLMHPAVNLDGSATHLFSPTRYVPDPSVFDSELATGVNDALICFVKCLKLYADRSPPVPDVHIEKLHKKFLQLIEDIPKYLKFVGKIGIPFRGKWQDPDGRREMAIKRNMFDFAAQMAAENPWTMIKQMCLEWFLTVVPSADFTTLTVAPFTPWKAATNNIGIENISAVTLPSKSILPILGAYIVRDAPYYETANTAGINPSGTIALSRDKNAFMGVCVSKSEDTNIAPLGCYKRFGVPEWLNEAILQYRAPSSGVGGPIKKSQEGQDFRDDDYKVTDIYIRESADAKLNLQRVVEQCYLMYYRATNTVAISGRLMITDGNEIIMPGNVITVNDEDELFSFYITNVTHRVNASLKEAKTTINGRYLRTMDEEILGEDKNPANPVY
ncbi:hypothetical protein ACFLQL_00240 [Verrucomicrobiota bacterium]